MYTEKWNVWIIGTNNNAWGNYGTKSPDYAAGKLAYSCRYAVPDGQTETVFAFCSYSAAGGNTCGNLIDNIHFSLYQTITAAATAAALWLLHRTFPCPLTALLAPANGSPWEMGKLLFWPYLPAALVIWRLSPERGSRGGHCLLLAVMPLCMAGLCWLLPGGELVWYVLAILVGIAYLLLTVGAPDIGPFADPAAAAMGTIPF